MIWIVGFLLGLLIGCIGGWWRCWEESQAEIQGLKNLVAESEANLRKAKLELQEAKESAQPDMQETVAGLTHKNIQLIADCAKLVQERDRLRTRLKHIHDHSGEETGVIKERE